MLLAEVGIGANETVGTTELQVRLVFGSDLICISTGCTKCISKG